MHGSLPLWKVVMHTTSGERKEVYLRAGSMISAARMAGSAAGEFHPVRVERALGV